jgi:hypothetical protein
MRCIAVTPTTVDRHDTPSISLSAEISLNAKHRELAPMVRLSRLAARKVVAEHREDQAGPQDGQKPDELRLKNLLPAVVKPALEYLNGQPSLEGSYDDQDHHEKYFERIHDLLHRLDAPSRCAGSPVDGEPVLETSA